MQQGERKKIVPARSSVEKKKAKSIIVIIICIGIDSQAEPRDSPISSSPQNTLVTPLQIKNPGIA